VEVREMDVQSRLGDSAALAALIRGLAAAGAEAEPEKVPTDSLAWSSFRAARDGLEAEIFHEGSLVELPDVARAAVKMAEPHARELGDADALEGIERILHDGNGAERQRAAHARDGDEGLLDLLVRETSEPL
jgi:carboxylate-amine ligase